MSTIWNIKFAGEVFSELIDSVIMVEPVTLVVLGIVAIGSFISGYYYNKPAEIQQIPRDPNEMHNVVIQNIKDTVQVEDHSYLIVGVYVIIGLLVLIIAGLIAQYYTKKIKKRTLRRVLNSGNELQNP